jgi:predicted permease
LLANLTNIILPLVAVVLAGFLYGRHHRPDMVAANQLNMDIFLPALIFSALAGNSFRLSDYYLLALGAAVVMGGSGLLAWPVARLCGYAPKTLLPPAIFKNAGNTGLPLLVLTYGTKALPAAVVLLLVANMLHFSIGAWWLGREVRIWTLWRVPVMLAGVAGLAVSLSGITVWPPIVIGSKVLGDVSVGLALFSLGVRLTHAPLGAWRIGLVGAIVGPVAGMLVAHLYALAVGLSQAEQDYLFLFGALPPAVLNYLFAERYHQEPDNVASIVMIGNLAAVVFLSVALAIRLPSP